MQSRRTHPPTFNVVQYCVDANTAFPVFSAGVGAFVHTWSTCTGTAQTPVDVHCSEWRARALQPKSRDTSMFQALVALLSKEYCAYVPGVEAAVATATIDTRQRMTRAGVGMASRYCPACLPTRHLKSRETRWAVRCPWRSRFVIAHSRVQLHVHRDAAAQRHVHGHAHACVRQ
jgi:hypothetical protein